MHKRRIELFWVDILISIDKVKRFSGSFVSEKEFQANDIAVSATLRELEVIGEAVKNILEDPTLSYEVNEQ